MRAAGGGGGVRLGERAAVDAGLARREAATADLGGCFFRAAAARLGAAGVAPSFEAIADLTVVDRSLVDGDIVARSDAPLGPTGVVVRTERAADVRLLPAGTLASGVPVATALAPFIRLAPDQHVLHPASRWVGRATWVGCALKLAFGCGAVVRVRPRPGRSLEDPGVLYPACPVDDLFGGSDRGAPFYPGQALELGSHAALGRAALVTVVGRIPPTPVRGNVQAARAPGAARGGGALPRPVSLDAVVLSVDPDEVDVEWVARLEAADPAPWRGGGRRDARGRGRGRADAPHTPPPPTVKAASLTPIGLAPFDPSYWVLGGRGLWLGGEGGEAAAAAAQGEDASPRARRRRRRGRGRSGGGGGGGEGASADAPASPAPKTTPTPPAPAPATLASRATAWAAGVASALAGGSGVSGGEGGAPPAPAAAAAADARTVGDTKPDGTPRKPGRRRRRGPGGIGQQDSAAAETAAAAASATAGGAPVDTFPAPRTALVVGTATTADVWWQDGTIERGLPSPALLPVTHLDDHDFWPNDLVEARPPLGAVEEEEEEVEGEGGGGGGGQVGHPPKKGAAPGGRRHLVRLRRPHRRRPLVPVAVQCAHGPARPGRGRHGRGRGGLGGRDGARLRHPPARGLGLRGGGRRPAPVAAGAGPGGRLPGDRGRRAGQGAPVVRGAVVRGRGGLPAAGAGRRALGGRGPAGGRPGGRGRRRRPGPVPLGRRRPAHVRVADGAVGGVPRRRRRRAGGRRRGRAGPGPCTRRRRPLPRRRRLCLHTPRHRRRRGRPRQPQRVGRPARLGRRRRPRRRRPGGLHGAPLRPRLAPADGLRPVRRGRRGPARQGGRRRAGRHGGRPCRPGPLARRHARAPARAGGFQGGGGPAAGAGRGGRGC